MSDEAYHDVKNNRVDHMRVASDPTYAAGVDSAKVSLGLTENIRGIGEALGAALGPNNRTGIPPNVPYEILKAVHSTRAVEFEINRERVARGQPPLRMTELADFYQPQSSSGGIGVLVGILGFLVIVAAGYGFLSWLGPNELVRKQEAEKREQEAQKADLSAKRKDAASRLSQRFGVAHSTNTGDGRVVCTSPFKRLECSGPWLANQFSAASRFELLTPTSGPSDDYQKVRVYYSKTADKVSWGAVAEDYSTTTKGPRQLNTPTRLDYFHVDIKHALGDILKELGFTPAMVQACEKHNATRVDDKGNIHHPLLKLKEDGGTTYSCQNYSGGRGYRGFISFHVSENAKS